MYLYICSRPSITDGYRWLGHFWDTIKITRIIINKIEMKFNTILFQLLTQPSVSYHLMALLFSNHIYKWFFRVQQLVRETPAEVYHRLWYTVWYPSRKNATSCKIRSMKNRILCPSSCSRGPRCRWLVMGLLLTAW